MAKTRYHERGPERDERARRARAGPLEPENGGAAPGGRHEPELHRQPMSESTGAIHPTYPACCLLEPASSDGDPVADGLAGDRHGEFVDGRLAAPTRSGATTRSWSPCRPRTCSRARATPRPALDPTAFARRDGSVWLVLRWRAEGQSRRSLEISDRRYQREPRPRLVRCHGDEPAVRSRLTSSSPFSVTARKGTAKNVPTNPNSAPPAATPRRITRGCSRIGRP